MSWRLAALALAGMLTGAIMAITGLIAILFGAEQEDWIMRIIFGLFIHVAALGFVVEVKDINRD